MRLLIPLIKLDSFFPEDIYVKGEALYDNKGINFLTELYKGKVLVVMEDTNKVEMRFNQESIVDINCTCQDFRIKKICPHIVASSFEVRKIAQKLELKTKKAKTPVRRKSKNRFNEILATLEKDDLVGFVSAYASKDKNFRLFFEAFFLNKLKNKNLGNSYGKLLDEVLPPSSDVDVRFTRQQISLLIDISKDLINQYKDEISLKRYTDAFDIIKHLLNKLSYAYNRNKNENLGNLLTEVHESFYMMFDDDIAPELKLKGYEYIFEMIGKSYYFYQNDNDLIHLFLSSNPLKEDYIKFLEVLNNKIIIIRDERAKKYYITFYIGLKKRLNLLEEGWYELYFKDMTDFMEIALFMLKEDFAIEHESLLKELYASEKISKRLFLDSQLRISLTLKDCERVGFLAYDIYENTYDFRYLKRARRCISAFTEDIKNKINELVITKAKEDEILTWWIMTENNVDLVKYLLGKNDIGLIQRYEIEILNKSHEDLQNLYLTYIHEYLESHYGEKSATVVKNLLYHLRQIDAKKIAFNIEKDLFDTFSSRKRFLKDLMGI